VTTQVIFLSQVDSLLTPTAAHFALQVTVASLASIVFGWVLVPIVRGLYSLPLKHNRASRGKKCHNADDEDVVVPWKRNVGRAFAFAVLLLLVAMTAMFVVFTQRLLSVYSCMDLVRNQIVPFVTTIAVVSLFPGIPVTILWYMAENSWGMPPDAVRLDIFDRTAVAL
jgi:hypothetical protein